MPEIEAPAMDVPEAMPESGAASVEESGLTAADSSPQAQTNFNPQEWAYTFRSETVQPKTREEMIELMQMGHSYRYNKPKWDQQKQELDERAKQYEPYQRLKESLDANPDFRDKLMQMYQEYNGQQVQNPADPRLDEISQKIETWEQRQADMELQKELDQVAASHPEIQWNKDLGEGSPRQQLVRFMAQKGINDPELAYRAMYFPKATQTAAHQAAAKTTQNIKQQHRAGVVSAESAAKPERAVDHSKLSWDDLSQMAINDLKSRG